VELSPEDIDEIEREYDFDVGFPHNFMTGRNTGPRGPGEIVFYKGLGRLDVVEAMKAIKPYR
jgi:hypothetical protein